MRASSPSATISTSALVLLLGAVGEVRGDGAVHALAVLVAVGLHPHEVDRSAESLLFADGDLQRHDFAAELLLERFHRPIERGPLAVHPVDHEDHGAAELGGELPGLLGLDLDAGDRVEDDQGRVGRRDGCPGFRREDAVPRGVEEVDPNVAVDRVGDRRG